MRTLHMDLFPTNYTDSVTKNGIKQIATNWLADAKSIIAGWKFTSTDIVNVVNELDQNSSDWLNQLVVISKTHEKCEQAEDFSYNLSFDDAKNHFTTHRKPTLPSIGFALIAYLLMLLSYMITKRSTKTIVGTSKSKGKFDIEY